MLFITDTQARAMGFEAGDGFEQAISDAGLLYGEIRQEPWQTETDLRAWGEPRGIGPDRFNAAVRVLSASGRVHILATAPEVMPVPTVPHAVALTRAELHESDAGFVKALAAVKDVPGRSGMSKAELVDALVGVLEPQ